MQSNSGYECNLILHPRKLRPSHTEDQVQVIYWQSQGEILILSILKLLPLTILPRSYSSCESRKCIYQTGF